MPDYIPIQDVITVGTSSVRISDKPNVGQKRVEFVLTNVSAGGQVIWLAMEQDAVVGQGLKPLAVGESMYAVIDSRYEPWQGRWNAVATAAGALLARSERTE